MNLWLEKYLHEMSESIQNMGLQQSEDWNKACNLIQSTRSTGHKVIIVGNGGSAAIASHVAVDLTKTSKVRAINFNEADLITCFANDYGYHDWVAEAIKAYADPGDTVIFISSSGRSSNIINGAIQAVNMGLAVVTLSGFNPDNQLRQLGHINLWVGSNQYNFVETAHQAWLLAIVDKIAEEAKC